MTDQTRSDDDDLVTKGFLRETLRREFQTFRTEWDTFRTEIRTEFRTEIRTEIASCKRELLYEIGHAVQVIVEQIGAKIAVIDDKYTPLQPRVSALEHALEEHRGDYTAHKRPRRTPPRRPR